MLAEASDEWSSFIESHGERTGEVVIAELQALHDAVPPGKGYRGRYRAKLACLIDALSGVADQAEVIATAKACRGPLPLAATSSAPEACSKPEPGRSAPACATAGRGGVGGSDEFAEIQEVVDRLCDHECVQLAFVLDARGMIFASGGDVEGCDTLTLSQLTAGELGAEECIARMKRERQYTTRVHEGVEHYIHVQVLDQLILAVVFRAHHALGIVRPRAEEAGQALEGFLERIPRGSALPSVTDADIDSLFR